MPDSISEKQKIWDSLPYSKAYHILNEVFNAVTHGISFIVAIIGMIFLLYKAYVSGQSVVAMFSYVLYGITACALFLFSTLYHSLYFTRAKKIMQKLDHSCIFLLIAGTYTPFCLVVLGGKLGLAVFLLEWAIAITGVVLKFAGFEKVKKISTALYLLMGWLVLFTIKPLYESIGKLGFMFLLLGGLSYTIGTVFYKLKNVKFMHVVWHLFVTAGSVFMWLAVYTSVG